MNKKHALLVIFLSIAVSSIPCEEVLFRIIEDAPVWVGNFYRQNNIDTIIKKDEIVKGIDSLFGNIDNKSCFLSVIEYNNKTYKVQSEKLIPAVTDDLFDDSWLADFNKKSDFYWIPSYYLTMLLSGNRDTLYEFEYKLIDWYKGIEGWDEYANEWYDHIHMDLYRRCLVMNQVSISAIDEAFGFLVTNTKTINNGYKITVVNQDLGKKVYDNYLSLSAIPFPTKPSFDLLLIRDNDYLDMYLDSTKNHLATFVMVNKSIMEEIGSLLKNNACDLSKIKSFPRRAAKQLNVGEECRILENLRLRETSGTAGAVIKTLEQGSKVTILEIGQNETIDGVTAPWVKVKTSNGETGWCFGLYLQETRFDPTPEELAVKVKSKTENTADSNDDKNKATSLPLWAWIAIIGIAVAVSGGVAVFVVKRKK